MCEKMCSTVVALPCPLCCQTIFPSVDSLRVSLVSVSSRLLQCPICSEMLMGLDKLTIHLFSHTLLNGNSSNPTTEHQQQQQQQHQQQQQLSVQQHRQHQHHHHHPNIQPPVAKSNAPHLNRSIFAVAAAQRHCHVCGCTFRNHELHQMHMQLVHDITIDDPIVNDDEDDDDAGVDTELEEDYFPRIADNQQQQRKEPQQQQMIVQQHSHNRTASDNHSSELMRGVQSVRFQCHICPKSYKLKGSLRVHMRVVHSMDGRAAGGADNNKTSDASNASPMSSIVSTSIDPVSATTSVVCTIPITFNHDGDDMMLSAMSTMTTKIPTTTDDEPTISNEPPKSIVISMGRAPVELMAASASAASVELAPNCISISSSNNNGGETSKLWECDICAKWFKTMYYLKKHKRLHTG